MHTLPACLEISDGHAVPSQRVKAPTTEDKAVVKGGTKGHVLVRVSTAGSTGSGPVRLLPHSTLSRRLSSAEAGGSRALALAAPAVAAAAAGPRHHGLQWGAAGAAAVAAAVHTAASVLVPAAAARVARRLRSSRQAKPVIILLLLALLGGIWVLLAHTPGAG